MRYKPLDVACGSCHADVHQGQFLDATLPPRTPGSPPGRRKARDCSYCHETADFKKTTFDHGDKRFTTFALDGKHQRVACAACHPAVRVTGDVATVRYRPVPRGCEDCHIDFHHGTFKGFEP